MTFRDLRLRLRALLMRSRVEREMRDELDFHVAMQSRKLRATGLGEEEARRSARARFGSLALVEDQLRDQRRVGWFDTTWQDVRYALRAIRRSPTFAATVIGTLALGLGLNTAVFTLFNTYVLKPFPIRDPQALYQFLWANNAGRWQRFTWAEYEQLRRGNPVFSDVFATAGRDLRGQRMVRLDGHVAWATLVSGNYFDLLGVGPALGRTLRESDSALPGGPPAVVLSHEYWTRQYAADPAIVGRIVNIRGCSCEVVGVARQGFSGLSETPPTDVWAPVTLEGLFEEGPDLFGPDHPRRVGIIGRLKPGVSKRAAEAALLLWLGGITQTLQEPERSALTELESLATSVELSPEIAMAVSPIFVAFGLVLLIACANVANMMLARGMARQREIGVRLTIGASRGRLIRQLLTESIVLAIPAALAGFAISRVVLDAGVRAVLATLPADFAEYLRFAPLQPDVRVFAFMAAAAVVASVAVGLAPALQTTRSNVIGMARGDFPLGYGPSRLRNALVVAQIAAATMLLITATVLLDSARELGTMDLGLTTHGVLTMDVRDDARARVLAAIEASPLVATFGATSAVPLDASGTALSIGTTSDAALMTARYRMASPEFFEVFDIPIVSGRAFTAAEAAAGAPTVAIVSEAAATALWPNENAVGQELHVVPSPRTAPGPFSIRESKVLVVGVSGNYVGAGPWQRAVTFPIARTAAATDLVLSVHGSLAEARRALQTTLDATTPGGVEQVHKFEDFAELQLYPFRASYWVAGVVGWLALLLTLSGVYGVLSYLVTQRTKEIGIRVALGAGARSVMALVLKQTFRLAAIGLAAGALLALGAAQLFSAIAGVDPDDMNLVLGVAAFLSGMAIVLGACLVASLVPALRAARLDPLDTLRAD